ncbi:MAG: thiamine-phosphate kinase [Planctomycetes bacterium]|nr:thiamine-phosphate kinase [Planctomycetota bacterium]
MELDFIRWLREHVPSHPRAPLGLSDDAAIVSLAGQSNVILTIDTLTDGVDFRVGVDDPRRIGRQALAANLSDLAAMAARPLAAVISLVLPRDDTGASLKLAKELYEGLLPLAQEYDVAIAGGDTNTFDGPLVISVAALGQPTGRGPLTRSGGKPGDWLLVTGSLGGSILGHMFDFTPRVLEAIVLHERYELHAAIDISDGLALDASRLAAESGCGAMIFTNDVPIAAAAYQLADQEAAANREAAALMHALSDGQDFELLFAATPETAQTILRDSPLECAITHVGELATEPGLWQQHGAGQRQPLAPIGWRH